MAINKDETSTLPRPITSQYYLDHLSQPEEIVVQVTEEDFDQALAELIPSVSAQELEHYKQVQKMFNSDDFAKEAEAAAAAEAEKKKLLYQEHEDKELVEALRKVEEAQNLISTESHYHHQQHENGQEGEEEGYVDVGKGKGKDVKGKGKGRSVEYSHVPDHVTQEQHHAEEVSHQTVEEQAVERTSIVEGGVHLAAANATGGLEEPLMVGEKDQEAIEEILGGAGNGGGKKNGKGKANKGKGRK